MEIRIFGMTVKEKSPFLDLEDDTHRLKGLEGTVEEEVPNHFPIFKRGNVEYEEIANHCQRGREHNPSCGQERGTNIMSV